MTELVREVLDAAASLAHRKGVELENATPVLPSVVGDALLLRQALFNLVHNAVTATPAGGRITVGAQTDQRSVTLTVSDTGSGVPAYALPRVFDRFYSLTPGTNGSPGSGLGLPFVREVALLHGGEARLENRPEGGACATLRLAVRPPRPPARSKVKG
jgi:two-component system sensor histidine kinase CreC